MRFFLFYSFIKKTEEGFVTFVLDLGWGLSLTMVRGTARGAFNRARAI